MKDRGRLVLHSGQAWHAGPPAARASAGVGLAAPAFRRGLTARAFSWARALCVVVATAAVGRARGERYRQNVSGLKVHSRDGGCIFDFGVPLGFLWGSFGVPVGPPNSRAPRALVCRVTLPFLRLVRFVVHCRIVLAGGAVRIRALGLEVSFA